MQITRQWLAFAGAAGLALTVALAPAPARAQGNDADKKVTLNLRDTPLRDAINLLFTGSGYQFSIDPNVLNVPVNLNIRDVGLQQALRLVIKQAGTVQPGLTFSRDGDIYVIKVRPPTAAPGPSSELPPEQTMAADVSALTWEKIPIQFTDAAIFVLAFGGTMLPTEFDVKANSGGFGGGYGGGGYSGGGYSGGGYSGGLGGYGGGFGGGSFGGGGFGGGGLGGFGGGLGGFGGGGLGGFGGGGFGGLGGGGLGGLGGGLGGFGGMTGGRFF